MKKGLKGTSRSWRAFHKSRKETSVLSEQHGGSDASGEAIRLHVRM